jgi:hypothetical protein
MLPHRAKKLSIERNSFYTKHILRFFRSNPSLPIELLLKRVRQAVKIETTGQQTPWYSSSMEGSFSFAEENFFVPSAW